MCPEKETAIQKTSDEEWRDYELRSEMYSSSTVALDWLIVCSLRSDWPDAALLRVGFRTQSQLVENPGHVINKQHG